MTRYKPKTLSSIWITWFSKVLADEAQCSLSVWFCSYYLYNKLPSNFDSASRIAKHRALLDKRVAFLEAEGYSISIEGENCFEVPERQYPITVAGKPDIVAIRDNVVWWRIVRRGS